MEVMSSCVDEISSLEFEWINPEPNKIDKTIYLHNSDRTAFKRCRRKWDFSSPFRQNLRTRVENHKPFWFGSAFNSAFVYGCCGFLNNSELLFCSVMSPRYIIVALSQ